MHCIHRTHANEKMQRQTSLTMWQKLDDTGLPMVNLSAQCKRAGIWSDWVRGDIRHSEVQLSSPLTEASPAFSPERPAVAVSLQLLCLRLPA